MELELEYLAHIIYGKSENLVIDVKEEALSEVTRRAIKYIKDYYANTLKVPGADIIHNEFGLQLDPPKQDLFYVKELLKKEYFHKGAKSFLQKTITSLNSKNYEEVATLLETEPMKVRARYCEENELTNLISDTNNEDIIDQYIRRENGVYGVLTPWKTINDWTWGWQKGDFTLFGARSGIGKSFFILHMAHHSWKQKNKIIIVSPEMSRISLTNRFASIHLKINNEKIRSGTLTTLMKERYFNFVRNKLEDVKGYGQVKIFSDKFRLDIESLRVLIESERPDCVYIDGVHLLRTRRESDKMKAAPIVADELKQMAKVYNVPVICTIQLNRDAIKLKAEEVTLGHLAQSDAYGWNADYVFILGRDSNETGPIMIVNPLKMREGELGKKLILNWDFFNYDFSEYIPKARNDYYSDAPF